MKRPLVLLWASTAAAAGIAAVAIITRVRRMQHSAVVESLRNAQEVLADCYRKIAEIDGLLPEPNPRRQVPANGRRRSSLQRAREA